MEILLAVGKALASEVKTCSGAYAANNSLIKSVTVAAVLKIAELLVACKRAQAEPAISLCKPLAGCTALQT
jgi:hypothetical protein